MSSSSSSPPRIKCQRVSLKEIEDATANFDERYALGQGGEAKVYLAQIMLGRSDITQVAVKHLKPNSSRFETEIQIMPKIQHPNIVSLLGYCNDSGQKILIYEYMANGSLADYVQKKQKHTTSTSSTAISLSWEQRLKICLGAALGLKHLHAETKDFAKGIIHRDVKPDNILLDANWVAKISDFGMFKLSGANQIDSAMPTMLKGTGGYYAPEYLKYQHVTRKIDVYAFGVVLFQVLCRKMPWDRGDESYYGMEDEDLGDWARQNVDSEIREEISDFCLNAFTEIIRKSLNVDPKKRPTMDEVVLTLHDALERQQLKAATEAEGSRLEQESGFFFNMKYFEEKVHAGEWDEVEKYLSGFTKVDDNRYSMKIFFEIRKQKYLEALDRQDRSKAVEILVTDLKVFSTFNEDLYKEITQLITLGIFRENEQLSEYGDTKTARAIMLVELKKLITANPLFREKLINQSFMERWTEQLQITPSRPQTKFQGQQASVENDFEDIGHARDMVEDGIIDSFNLKKSRGELYRIGEVSKHNRKDDCWIIISGKVYDVTSFLDDHPGGDEIILQVAAGKDATNDFEYVGHTNTARYMMEEFYVGAVDPVAFHNSQGT